MVSEFLHWVFIVVIGLIGLFGIVCAYFIGRHVFASISPEMDEKFELYFILKDIKRYFGFLFEKGFKIRDAHYAINPNGSWYVSLESQDCIMSIIQDRSEISIYFSPVFGSDNPGDRFGLETLIYFLSQGQNFIGNFEGNLAWGKKKQFERLADLLKKYIDQIAPFFGSNYREHKDELRDAQKKSSSIQWSKIRGEGN